MSLDYQLVSTTKGHNNCTILHLKFSPDGNLLLSVAQDSSICIWDCRPLVYNQPIQPYLSFVSQQGLITSIAWCSLNSEFITGGGDGTIQVWNIKDNKIEQSAILKGHHDSITSIAARVTNILTISSGSKMVISKFGMPMVNLKLYPKLIGVQLLPLIIPHFLQEI